MRYLSIAFFLLVIGIAACSSTGTKSKKTNILVTLFLLKILRAIARVALTRSYKDCVQYGCRGADAKHSYLEMLPTRLST